MEDQILINCFVPCIKQDFDVLLPKDKVIYEVLELLSKSISELSGGLFITEKDNVLCIRNSGKVLNINLTVREHGLTNGSMLMLI